MSTIPQKLFRPYRFRDLAAMSSESNDLSQSEACPTVYLTEAMARSLRERLIAIADDISERKFGASPIGTVYIDEAGTTTAHYPPDKEADDA